MKSSVLLMSLALAATAARGGAQDTKEAPDQSRKNSIVHAPPLIHVVLSGAIGHPGYYSIPSSMRLGDVIMKVGGPTQEADLNKVVIRRDRREIVKASQVSAALTAERTLDDLHIAPGDEIAVGERSRQNGLENALRATYILTGLAGLVLAVTSR
jgi:hypothetical protein